MKELNLPTLAYRRIRGDLIETYKIASGKYDPEVSDILTFTDESDVHKTMNVSKVSVSRMNY